MLITESNKGTFCLAPTGEEAMLEFAREKLKSYKNLPVTYYQIGEKYRQTQSKKYIKTSSPVKWKFWVFGTVTLR